MKIIPVISLALALTAALTGCATQHTITSSTPRSITVKGPSWTDAEEQKAHSLAESECQKHGRHATLEKLEGSKPSAVWNFNCVL